MDVLSYVGVERRRQALRTLRKGLGISSRRRKHGTTGRLALPHQNTGRVELLRPSVQLPARDPRISGVISILGVLARESRGCGPKMPPEPGRASSLDRE